MVITALILSITHGGNENVMSDQEIIKRAEALGMVQKERDLLAEATKKPAEEEAVTPDITGKEELEDVNPDITGEEEMEDTQKDSEQEKAQVTKAADKNFTDDILAMATGAAKPSQEVEITKKPELTKEAEPTKEESSITPTQKPTATPETTLSATPTPQTTEKKVITIVSGMWSDRVARELQAIGAVEDAADFDQFLVKNGYANRIVVGTFEIPANASYEQIARIITTR